MILSNIFKELEDAVENIGESIKSNFKANSENAEVSFKCKGCGANLTTAGKNVKCEYCGLINTNEQYKSGSSIFKSGDKK